MKKQRIVGITLIMLLSVGVLFNCQQPICPEPDTTSKFKVNFGVEGEGGTLSAKIKDGADINSGDEVEKGTKVVFTATSNTTPEAYTVGTWKENGTEINGTAQSYEVAVERNTDVKVAFKKANANYTVEYYQQKTVGDEYAKFESETKTGTTGDLISVTPKTYAGFTIANIVTDSVKADGTGVAKVYYNRNTITLTLNVDNGADATTLSGRFGATVMYPTGVESPVKAGYEFKGWVSALPATFPVTNQTHTAQWSATGIAVTGFITDGYSADREGTESWIVIKGEHFTRLSPGEIANISASLGTITNAHVKNDTTIEAAYTIPDLADNDPNGKSETVTVQGQSITRSLHTLKIENSTTKIEVTGFYSLSLSSEGKLFIPELVTSIKDASLSVQTGVFADQETIKEVHFPQSLTSIGAGAFYYASLKEVDLSQTALTSIGNEAFSFCMNLTTVQFPASLETIGEKAFFVATALTTVNLSGTALTSIGNEAFRQCTKLASLTFPASLETVGEMAFSQTALENVNLSGTALTSIKNNAFNNCIKLATVTFPASLETIDPSAFYKTALTTATFANTEGWAVYDNMYYTIGKVELTDLAANAVNWLKQKTDEAPSGYAEKYWKRN